MVAAALLLVSCSDSRLVSESAAPTTAEQSTSANESDTAADDPTTTAGLSSESGSESEPGSTDQESADASDSPTTTEPKTATTTTAESANEFRSPTGNIHCRIDLGTARCSHRGDTPWKAGGALPNWATGLSFGFTEAGCIDGGFVGFDVSESGRPQAACGDQMVEAADKTLAYGEAMSVGGITCQSQRFGVTCLNREGNGFRLATNEIAMLYQRSQDWITEVPSSANQNLRFSNVGDVPTGTLIKSESDSAKCYLSAFEQQDSSANSVECQPIGGSGPNDDWSPDQRSCQGADFYGYALFTGPGALGTATFGCTTDLGPLADPSTPSQVIEDGDGVRIGDITCGNSDGALACFTGGDGMLVSEKEVSFFYQRDV